MATRVGGYILCVHTLIHACQPRMFLEDPDLMRGARIYENVLLGS